jgi:hypothetical protein
MDEQGSIPYRFMRTHTMIAIDDPIVIDSNGQKYIAGYDEHGWYSIVMIELFPTEEADETYPTVEYDGKEYAYEKQEDTAIFSFDGEGIEKLKQKMS